MKALAIAFMVVGWTLVLALVITLTGCVDEAKDWGADQASLADAIAQAAKEGI